MFGNIVKGNDVISKIASDENCLYIDNDHIFRLPSGAVNCLLYNNGGIHFNRKGSVKLANNLGIKEVQYSKARKNDGASQCGKRHVQRNSRRGQNKSNTSRTAGKVNHETRNRSSKQYRRHSSQNQRETTCWYCGEENHVSKNCRHGKYIQCIRCNEYGHKEKHCNF